MSATRLLIHGSCVSRDTMPFLGARYELAGYTARQSLISSMSAPVELPGPSRLDSPFQARLVRDDFASSIPGVLRSAADDVDLLVLDLVDERLGVLALPGGMHVTRSQELLDSGLTDRLPAATESIPFSSDEHFARWRTAADAYVELLRQTGLLERTLLIVATFAATTDAGGPVTQWRGEPAAAWNERYERYHDVLVTAGLRSHVVGKRAVASTKHQWGPSAYHYVDDAYLAIAATIRELVP